ncbi:hypothetical protein BH23GEM5_BH23GEM5_11090 [soil metagenome]
MTLVVGDREHHDGVGLGQVEDAKGIAGTVARRISPWTRA